MRQKNNEALSGMERWQRIEMDFRWAHVRLPQSAQSCSSDSVEHSNLKALRPQALQMRYNKYAVMYIGEHWSHRDFKTIPKRIKRFRAKTWWVRGWGFGPLLSSSYFFPSLAHPPPLINNRCWTMAENKRRWYSRVTNSYLSMLEFAIYAFILVYIGYINGSRQLFEWSFEARRDGHYFLSKDDYGYVVRLPSFSWSHFCLHFCYVYALITRFFLERMYLAL